MRRSRSLRPDFSSSFCGEVRPRMMSSRKRPFSRQVNVLEKFLRVIRMGWSIRAAWSLCSLASRSADFISLPGAMPILFPSFCWTVWAILAKR